MSINHWSPESQPTTVTIDQAVLARFISYAEQQQLNQLSTLLSQKEQQEYSALMLLPATEWQQATADYSAEQLIALIKFFTVAEKLPAWFAGERSPVIPLAKNLKQKQAIDRELLSWIKNHSDNRFLPYGPL